VRVGEVGLIAAFPYKFILYSTRQSLRAAEAFLLSVLFRYYIVSRLGGLSSINGTYFEAFITSAASY
jgi:hypothetical protein